MKPRSRLYPRLRRASLGWSWMAQSSEACANSAMKAVCCRIKPSLRTDLGHAWIKRAGTNGACTPAVSCTAQTHWGTGTCLMSVHRVHRVLLSAGAAARVRPVLTGVHSRCCRLLGVHMNCCATKKAAGSDVPRDCKLALLTATLQWQAHYAASQQHAASVWVN